MTVSVSEKLRDALERLDQAIDRLESGVSVGQNFPLAAAGAAKSIDTSAIAARLDRLIERVETVLAV
jgi:hypothetical protein